MNVERATRAKERIDNRERERDRGPEMLNMVLEIEDKIKTKNELLVSLEIDNTSGDIADTLADIQSLQLTDGDAVDEEE